MRRIMPMVISVASYKGGGGKTTTSIHLAAYFQQLGPTLRAAATRGSRDLGLNAEQRVPSPKDFFEFVIQDFGSGLQEEVRASQRPVHLLQLDEASAHHLVDRRFDERRADRFTLPVPLAEIGDGF